MIHGQKNIKCRLMFGREVLVEEPVFSSVSRFFRFWSWEVGQIFRHNWNSHKRSLYSNSFISINISPWSWLFFFAGCCLGHLFIEWYQHSMPSTPPLMESCGKDFPFITRNHNVTFRFLNLPETKPSTATLSREMGLNVYIFVWRVCCTVNMHCSSFE